MSNDDTEEGLSATEAARQGEEFFFEGGVLPDGTEHPGFFGRRPHLRNYDRDYRKIFAKHFDEISPLPLNDGEEVLARIMLERYSGAAAAQAQVMSGGPTGIPVKLTYPLPDPEKQARLDRAAERQRAADEQHRKHLDPRRRVYGKDEERPDRLPAEHNYTTIGDIVKARNERRELAARGR